MDAPRTPTILVVEDDDAILALARETLRDEGYRVIGAASVEDARAALSAFRCVLVLTDTMGASAPADPTFWGGLEAIRAAAGGTPVVIFSAHRPELFDGHEARGFAGVLPKPFDLDGLADAVRRFAGEGAARA